MKKFLSRSYGLSIVLIVSAVFPFFSLQANAKGLTEQLELLGTCYSRIEGDCPWALVRNSQTGEEEIFKKNQIVFGIGLVNAIKKNSIEISDSEGNEFEISIDGRAHRSTLPLSNTIRTSEFQEIFLRGVIDMRALVSDAKEDTQVVEGESIVGITLDKVPSSSLLTHLGVQTGDFLYLINGEQAFDMSELFKISNYSPDEEGKIVLHVLRDGEVVELITHIQMT